MATVSRPVYVATTDVTRPDRIPILSKDGFIVAFEAPAGATVSVIAAAIGTPSVDVIPVHVAGIFDNTLQLLGSAFPVAHSFNGDGLRFTAGYSGVYLALVNQPLTFPELVSVTITESAPVGGAVVNVLSTGNVYSQIPALQSLLSSVVGGGTSITLNHFSLLTEFAFSFSLPKRDFSSASRDFNLDGRTDLLWQHDNGAASVWALSGATITGSAGFAANPGPSWHLEGSGDFNGDGLSDVLWQNDNGAVAVWLLNGTFQIGGGTLATNPGPSWHAMGAADFNGDGRSDLLWQNDSGAVAVWTMNGATATGGGTLATNPGSAWHVVGADDFDGDGRADIVWQNDSGAVAVWLMNGATATGGGVVAANPGAAWHVVGTGDFTGDGRADLLWQDETGAVSIWAMNGAVATGAAVLAFNPGVDWHAGTASLDGDGLADIMFQHNSGAVAAWFMNGATILGSTGFGNPGGSWHLI